MTKRESEYEEGDVVVFDASGYKDASNRNKRTVGTIMSIHKNTNGTFAYSIILSDLSDMTPYWVEEPMLQRALIEDINNLSGININ